ncbi:hypothetical protein PR048_028454, partial [Dryococelus australis]
MVQPQIQNLSLVPLDNSLLGVKSSLWSSMTLQIVDSRSRQKYAEQRPAVFVGHIQGKLWHCQEDFSIQEPGHLSHSRWLTAANRVLRLYISVSKPSENFKVTFILKYLSDDQLQIVEPIIECNAFFAYPENLLLAMIVDEREHIRELGYRILKARQYTSKVKRLEILCHLRQALKLPITLTLLTGPIKDIRKFPCHTQAVERCVKLVPEASTKVCGREARDSDIRSTLLSRSVKPDLSKSETSNLYTLTINRR